MNYKIYILIYIGLSYLTTIIISIYTLINWKKENKNKKRTKTDEMMAYAIGFFIAFSPITLLTFLYTIIKNYVKEKWIQ